MSVKQGVGYRMEWYGDQWEDALAAATDEALTTLGGAIAREAKQRLRPQLSRAQTGQLARAIDFTKPHTDKGQRVVDVGVTGAGAGAGGEPPFHYALAVEFGRRAGAKPPPSSALERFVRLVIKPKPAQVKGLAFVIARSIGRKGIKPRPYFKPSFDRIWPMAMGVLREKLAPRIARIREKLNG